MENLKSIELKDLNEVIERVNLLTIAMGKVAEDLETIKISLAVHNKIIQNLVIKE